MVMEDDGVLINSRLLTYDLKVGLDVRNKTKCLGYDDLTTLNVVCANLISCIRKGSVLAYSQIGRAHV